MSPPPPLFGREIHGFSDLNLLFLDSPMMDDNLLLLMSWVLASCGAALYLRQRRKRKRVVRRYWVRPFYRRRDSSTHQNMMHLYQELLLVGIVISKLFKYKIMKVNK